MNTSDNNIDDAIKQLHYHVKWFEYGLLSQQQVIVQYQQYLSNDDKNSEHYRYHAFRQFLTENQHLSDQMLAQYIELAQLDPDQSMASAALIDLIKFNLLTDEQLLSLNSHPAFASELLQKRLALGQLKRRLLNKLSTDAVIDEELFQEVLESKESWLQLKLIAAKQVNDAYLKILVKQGSNNAVRNLALQRLKKRSK
jgi:hypothetical protein